MSLRVPADAAMKVSNIMRGNVVRLMLDHYDDVNEAREAEQCIYEKGNRDDIYVYTDAALEHVTSMRKGLEPESFVLNPVIESKTDEITDETLREMFNVDFGELLGNKVFMRCSKCKSIEIYVQQRQTRSADEGMSVFATCQVSSTSNTKKKSKCTHTLTPSTLPFHDD